MLSFSNDEKVKEKYLDEIKAFMLLEQFAGHGNEKLKDLKIEDDKFGLPWWAYSLIFSLFRENDPYLEYLNFFEQIPVGIDFNKIKNSLYVFMLKYMLSLYDNNKYPESYKLAQYVIDLYSTEEIDAHKLSIALKATDKWHHMCSNEDVVDILYWLLKDSMIVFISHCIFNRDARPICIAFRNEIIRLVNSLPKEESSSGRTNETLKAEAEILASTLTLIKSDTHFMKGEYGHQFKLIAETALVYWLEFLNNSKETK